MKKVKLFDLIKNTKFGRGNDKSREPNPFYSGSKRNGGVAVDLGDDENMTDFVRGRGSKQGMDTIARSELGTHAGVSGSKFDDIVRDLDGDEEDEFDEFDDIDVEYDGDFPEFDDEKDDLYLGTKDRSYAQNEFNGEEDIDDFDSDAGWAFMRQLDIDAGEDEFDADDEEDEFDDDEFDDGDSEFDADASDDSEEGEDEGEFGIYDDEDDEFANKFDDRAQQKPFREDDEDPDDEFSDDDPDAQLGNPEDTEEEEDEDFDDSGDEKEESKYDGIVRAIKGAYLVSKQQQPDETYSEVWIYNVGDKYNDDSNIRKDIMSGTDIDPTKNFSEDGSQEAVLKTVGNVQFLTLTGLPD